VRDARSPINALSPAVCSGSLRAEWCGALRASGRPLRRRCAAAHRTAGAALVALAVFSACCSDGGPPRGAEPTPAPQVARARHRGLWVLAEGDRRVLEHPERIDELVRDARALGATDLFVQVYRGGRAWYDSALADATPYRHVHDATGIDPLALLLGRAASAGLHVHAWVNVLSLSQNPKAPIVAQLGRDAVLVDRRGRSLLDYPGYEVPAPDRAYYRMGTPGLYLDPAAPGVSEWLAALFGELVTRYPALAGLHLDYIRYPDVLPFTVGTRFGVGLDFGYGAASRARFAQETGKRAPYGGSIENADAWDDWRRDRVSAVVREIASAVRARRPGIALSAAVWSHVERAYLAIQQDWRSWLEEGTLDFAVPMAYTRDDRLLRYQAEDFAGLPVADRIWLGLGTWLFADDPQRALAQIQLVRDAGLADVSLFSYDAIASDPALREALRAAAQVDAHVE
jgi:uncharacterized lipoprotein YddW (UPF0748 family)